MVLLDLARSSEARGVPGAGEAAASWSAPGLQGHTPLPKDLKMPQTSPG